MEDKYSQIQLLNKYNRETTNRDTIFPQTVIAAIHDNVTGASLESILSQFNCRFVPFCGTPKATRNNLPLALRRKGAIICYELMDGKVVVDMNINAEYRKTEDWGDDKNWVLLSNTRETLEAILKYIEGCSKFGFNVSINGILGGAHTIESAITDVPKELRSIGLYITFYAENELDSTRHWQLWQYTSDSLLEYEDEYYWVRLPSPAEVLAVTEEAEILIENIQQIYTQLDRVEEKLDSAKEKLAEMQDEIDKLQMDTHTIVDEVLYISE